MSNFEIDKSFIHEKFNKSIHDITTIILEAHPDIPITQINEKITVAIKLALTDIFPTISSQVESFQHEQQQENHNFQILHDWAKEQMGLVNPNQWIHQNFIPKDQVFTCKHKNFVIEKQNNLTYLPPEIEFYSLSISHCPNFELLDRNILQNCQIAYCPNFKLITANTQLNSLKLIHTGPLTIQEGCSFNNLSITNSEIQELPQELSTQEFFLINSPKPVRLPSFGNQVLETINIENVPQVFLQSPLQANNKIFILQSSILNQDSSQPSLLTAPNILLFDISNFNSHIQASQKLILDNCDIKTLESQNLQTLNIINCSQITEISSSCYANQATIKNCPQLISIPSSINAQQSQGHLYLTSA